MGSTFIDRMISLVEGAERQKTPNEIALNILLAGLTIISVFATVNRSPSYATYCRRLDFRCRAGGAVRDADPTTIGALLSAIGIAGMDRLLRFNTCWQLSGRAVEAAGDVDNLLLEKTGTITLGNRQATAFRPVRGVTSRELRTRRNLPRSPTKPGRPLDRRAGQGKIRYPQPRYGGTQRHVRSVHRANPDERRRCRRVVGPQGRGRCDPELRQMAGATSSRQETRCVRSSRGGADGCRARDPGDFGRNRQVGGTPLAVAKDGRLLGVVQLKDIVKGGIRERFANSAAWASAR